jgi:alpha-1,3-rhamnosyl/mannosyltransferase
VTEPVRVGVNLLWCVPGEVGGSEQYLVRQLVGLSDLDTCFVPTIYCVPTFIDAHPELAEKCEMVAANISGRDRTRRVFAEHTWLARRTGRCDLVHHGGGTAPSGGGRPIVLTIHDLQYESLPEYISPLKLRYLRTMMPRSVARADVVAVPTEYVKSTVLDRFELEADRVMVVPHGVEPSFGDGRRTDADLRADYGLGPGRVLVLPAVTHPHKGHEFLLDVMATHWHDPDLKLVLIGGKGAADDDVNRAITRLGLEDRVVRAGRVSDDDRDGLIGLADALVFPTEYEGFGAPVVEAMALGTPVVCSDQAAVKEVVGDAGLVLELAPEAWADALDTVDRERASMTSIGLERATSFTAAASGAGLAAAYRRALDGTAT